MAACPRCGADRSLARDGPCPSCGRVEIDLANPAATPKPHVVATSRRHRRKAVVLGSLAVLVVGGLSLTALRSDDGESVTPPTAHTAPTTTAATTTSSPTFATVPPTLSPPTTVVRRMNNTAEDYLVFGEKVDYRLYLVDSTNRVAGYVDPNTGRFYDAEVSLRNSSFHPTDDGRLFVSSNGASIVDRDLKNRQDIDGRLGGQGFEPGAPGRIWSHRYDRGPDLELSEIDAAGNVYTRSQAPSAVGHLSWLSGTEFVVTKGGRIFIFDAKTAQSRTYAVGELSTVQSERVVWRSCDNSLRCTLYLGTATNPTWRSLGDQPYVNEGALSPDANWVMLAGSGSALLRNLRTNQDKPMPRNGSIRGWTPDSRFLLFRSALGFAALDLQSDRVIELNLAIDLGTMVAI